MIKWTGLAPWESEFPFRGSLISTFPTPHNPPICPAAVPVLLFSTPYAEPRWGFSTPYPEPCCCLRPLSHAGASFLCPLLLRMYVQSLGFEVLGLRAQVGELGFGVQAFVIYDLGSRTEDLGFRVLGEVFRVEDS